MPRPSQSNSDSNTSCSYTKRDLGLADGFSWSGTITYGLALAEITEMLSVVSPSIFTMVFKDFVLFTSFLAALVVTPIEAQAETKQLFHVEKGVELENIAVRSNGKLLTTGISRPILYQFDPAATESVTELITIPGAKSLTGIAEFAPDIFAVLAGNWTRGTTLAVGTFSTWSIDLRSSKPVIAKLLDFPRAAFLNGITTIPRRGGNATLLITDTGTGSIYHLDPTTSQLQTVLAPNGLNTTTSPAAPQAGINGIRYNAVSQTLYYTNTIRAVFCKIALAVSSSNTTELPSITTTGPFTVIASQLPGDDFAIAADGTAFIGANPVNTLYKVTPAGNVTVFAGGRNESVVAGATSAAFGRTKHDRSTIYVSTNGIPPLVANATSEGGTVVAIKVGDGGFGDLGCSD